MPINGVSKLRDAKAYRNASTIRDLERRNSLLAQEREVLNRRITTLKFQRLQCLVLGALAVYSAYVLPNFFN
jgi:hypothetical protein